MAIQKINLGTEPLGEGGDTYRSANTKINENFSNTDHAASRLVGTSNGQIPLAEQTFKAAMSSVELGYNRSDNSLYDADNFEEGTYYYIDHALGVDDFNGTLNAPVKNNNSDYHSVLWTMRSSTTKLNKVQVSWGVSHPRLRYRTLNGFSTQWVEFYSDYNTKKDSKTNLLLASSDSIPNESAASRLVGTEKDNVMEVGAFGLGKRGSTTSGALSEKGDGIYTYANSSTEVPEGVNKYMPSCIKVTGNTNNRYSCLWMPQADGSRVVITQHAPGYREGLWLTELWHNRNTKLDTNGALAPSSPTIDLYSDRIEANEDGAKMNPEFVRNGVGDYTIKNTTGLRDEGWYIKIPNDMNGNPKVAVAIDTDEDGNLNIKTYKRTFSMETFTFGPDLDEPLDIPEGRWIDLRFNDLPQEELIEPELEEEPIEDEVEEPEVVEEEPVEESE